MSANFLHGIETIQLNKGARPVQVVKSGVIAIVGIAPTDYGRNVPTVVTGDQAASLFGKPVPGFNIPQALNAILDQGTGGTVIVVNVFNSTDHTSAVTAEPHVIANAKTKLTYAPIGSVTVLKTDGTTPAVLTKGTDYTIDEYGNFKVLSTAADAADGVTLKFTYKKLNAAAITSSVIKGSVDGTTGARTGFQCLSLCKNLFGFGPKILISPNYSSVNAVAVEMISQADALRAIALLDAPYGTTVANAIAGRGIAGTINFNTGSKRAFLLYPYLKAYDEATDSNIDFPYSQFMAGVIANTDNELGFWYSPSNREIKGIVGSERNISAGINDPTSDANMLNEVGITTIFNTFGTGNRTWGNRNASWPTNTAPDNFLSVVRTSDVISESVENAVLQFIDRPINQALIDEIRETCNQFVRVLIGRGALMPGSRVEFPTEVNTIDQIALGRLTFDKVMLPPPPLERVTFRDYLDINLLKNLS